MKTEQLPDDIIAIIATEYIELDKLLKRENLAASGGEARYLISQELVQVNGIVETRKRRKLYPGDEVLFNEVKVRVTGKEPLLRGDVSGGTGAVSL